MNVEQFWPEISSEIDNSPNNTSMASKLGYLPKFHDKFKILSISRNESRKTEFYQYQVIDHQQKKIVDRNYLIENQYLEHLCEFYESNIHFVSQEKKCHEVYFGQQQQLEQQELTSYIKAVSSKDIEQLHQKNLQMDMLFSNSQELAENLYILHQRDIHNKSFDEITLQLYYKGLNHWSYRYNKIQKLRKKTLNSGEQKLLLDLCNKNKSLDWEIIEGFFNSNSLVREFKSRSILRDNYRRITMNAENWNTEKDLELVELVKIYEQDIQKIGKEMGISMKQVQKREELIYMVMQHIRRTKNCSISEQLGQAKS